jgi:hypothetical protein
MYSIIPHVLQQGNASFGCFSWQWRKYRGSYACYTNIAIVSIGFYSSCYSLFFYLRDKLGRMKENKKVPSPYVAELLPYRHPSCLIKLIPGSGLVFFSSLLKLLIYQAVNLLPAWISADYAFTGPLSALYNITYTWHIFLRRQNAVFALNNFGI